tara:strand:+ start:2873 stop:3388 length:516 start_codon:yes stop_codon:yes gene_type:complete
MSVALQKAQALQLQISKMHGLSGIYKKGESQPFLVGLPHFGIMESYDFERRFAAYDGQPFIVCLAEKGFMVEDITYDDDSGVFSLSNVAEIGGIRCGPIGDCTMVYPNLTREQELKAIHLQMHSHPPYVGDLTSLFWGCKYDKSLFQKIAAHYVDYVHKDGISSVYWEAYL